MKKYVKMKFNASLENVTFARGTVASFLINEEITLNEMNEIKTIVSEAVTNCIIHAYENRKGIIKINSKLENEKIIIEISDNGKGIENVEVAKEPLYTTKPNLERSGMGFTIMESFMDNMKVESIVGLGTKVTLEKIINKKENQENEEKNEDILTKE